MDGDADKAAVHSNGLCILGARSDYAAGGIFLLFKATTELHERLENREHDTGQTKGYASFWVVVTQIVILDAVFSLDAVITAVVWSTICQ